MKSTINDLDTGHIMLSCYYAFMLTTVYLKGMVLLGVKLPTA